MLIARKHSPSFLWQVQYKEVRDQHRKDFRLRHFVSWEDRVPQDYFIQKSQNRIIVPFLRDVWDTIRDYGHLSEIAETKKGVEHRTNLRAEELEKVLVSGPSSETRKAIIRVTPGFRQFTASETWHISVAMEYRRFTDSTAWNLPWHEPKVVVPTSRMSRGPWRFAAAIDKAGRIVNRRFYAMWPKSSTIGVEVLAAILNSPIGQAYTYAHSFQRDIPKRVYDSIPIPANLSSARPLIEGLVNEYLESLKSAPGNSEVSWI